MAYPATGHIGVKRIGIRLQNVHIDLMSLLNLEFARFKFLRQNAEFFGRHLKISAFLSQKSESRQFKIQYAH